MRRSRSTQLLMALALSMIGALAASPALGDTLDDQAAAYAVQNREYPLRHELNIALGVLPMNAFDKGITVGGGYTYHFSQTWAWEVFQFVYDFHDFDTGLKDDLLNNFGVMPTKIVTLKGFLTTSLMLKPFYGKLAVVNRSVVHVEMFLLLGGGVGYYGQDSTYRPGGDLGLGLRFFFGKTFSLRIDARDNVFYKTGSIQNELYFALSGAFTFGQ